MQAWKKLAIFANTMVFCSFAFASEASDFSEKCEGFFCRRVPDNCLMHFVVTGSAGWSAISHTGETQTFPVIDGSMYAYSSDNTNQLRGLYGGFVGAEFNVNRYLAWQVGLGYYQTKFAGNGKVLQGADIESSDQFPYSSDITSQQALVESKLLFNWQTYYHPYVLFGLGAGWNNATNYQVSPPPFLTFTPRFADNIQASLSYSVGLGIDVDLPLNFRIGVGYRYTDLGTVRLGRGNIDAIPIPETLSQAHLYTNEVLAQLTYVFA